MAVALAFEDDGVMYATQYTTSKYGAHDGAVVAIDPRSGAPSMVIDGFHEPIGLAKLGRELVVADARARAVFRVEVIAGRGVARFMIAALPDRPTALCACGMDAVLVASFEASSGLGMIRKLCLDGRTRILAAGAWEPTNVSVTDDGVHVSVRGTDDVLVFDR